MHDFGTLMLSKRHEQVEFQARTSARCSESSPRLGFLEAADFENKARTRQCVLHSNCAARGTQYGNGNGLNMLWTEYWNVTLTLAPRVLERAWQHEVEAFSADA